MGKAYTETERKEIRQRIWEESLNMFHEETRKTLNMRELTERVGISLGSFYNFYKDKKSLVTDVMEYRVKQKLNIMKATFPDSKKDPVQYVFEILYDNFTDMEKKIQNKEIYKEMFQVAFTGSEEEINHFFDIYQLFIGELQKYWEDEQTGFVMDKEGIMSLIRGTYYFYESEKYMKETYFDELLQMFIRNGVEKYVRFSK